MPIQTELPFDPSGAPRPTRARHTIAIGSGKGGVGKSLIAANLGIYLAQLGRRVVLLDADLGGANLHSFLGIDRPRVTLGDFFDKRVDRIEECVVETAVKNLGLVSAEGDPPWAANPHPATRDRLLSQACALDVDYLLCDLPPGSGFTALDFFLVAGVGMLVVVPEPTSIENTFRFIKSAFLRRIRSLPGLTRLPLDRSGQARQYEDGMPAPLDLYRAALPVDPALAARILDEMWHFRPRVVVNQTRARADLDLGSELQSAGRRRLGLAVDYLGHLESDDAVWLAVRRRRPLVVEYPEAKVTKNLERIVRRLLAMESERVAPTTGAPPRPTEEQTLYEVLELDPGASDEDIRRAYRRGRDLYDPESIVLAGLYGAERLEIVHRRLEAAYDTLLDPERRRRYDIELFPGGIPSHRRSRTAPPIARSEETPAQGDEGPEPVLTPSTEFSGPLLRRLRAIRRVELAEIAQRTKIGVGHLRAIEEERWDALPALVYLRGFLVEYARCLKLEPQQVARSYLDRLVRERPSIDPEVGGVTRS